MQATYILDLPAPPHQVLRIELENEKADLERQIEELRAILGDEKLLLRNVSTGSLADVAKAHGTPRRTVLLESAGMPVSTPRAARSRWRSPTTRAGCCSPRPACSPGP